MPAPRSVERTRGHTEGTLGAKAWKAAEEGEVKVLMAFHATAGRKQILIAAAVSLILLGTGVGLRFG
jgi:hypothetical protein